MAPRWSASGGRSPALHRHDPGGGAGASGLRRGHLRTLSSADQRRDLDRQVARLVEHSTVVGMAPTKVVSEVGSGLNGHRTKLLGLLRDPGVGTIVVEHRDRLARFGVEYLEAALAAQGRRLIVVEGAEVTDDFGARHGGRCSPVLRPSLRPPFGQTAGAGGVGGD